MNTQNVEGQHTDWPKLKTFPLPAKALISAVILTMALAMTGAMGQIIVHDIVPTFFSASHSREGGSSSMPAMQSDAAQGEDLTSRGDLFSEEPVKVVEEKPSFFKSEQFVWTLKWTHIHLFGMNMIFIIMGGVCVFLDLGLRARAWLIVLPFVGVFIDITAMWLKAFVSPAFFWLHIPGGGLFGVVFIYVGIRAMVDMWGTKVNRQR
ncbi:MAG: hypothetical protein JSW26_02005 [Desulfobacterales bacterium]|nr:MAG: hypothetical protein JSW26_02005 [Desulfobacterales bacterium]